MRVVTTVGTLLLALCSGSLAAQLEPCDNADLGPGAECGTIRVLEDRSDPDGRAIDLETVVLRARKPDGRAPLFLLAGGPGVVLPGDA